MAGRFARAGVSHCMKTLAQSLPEWRRVRHPMRLCVFKGWTWGTRQLISPRGTVFLVRPIPGLGVLAQPRQRIQTKGNPQ